MAEVVFLRNKRMLNIIEVPKSEYEDPKKWGDAEKEHYEVIDSEEDRNQAAWEQVVKDSKRHDAEVKKNDDLREEGVPVATEAPRATFDEPADTDTGSASANKRK